MTPAGSATFFHGDLIRKYFLRSFSPFQGPITYGLKSLDRFYDAILPCPTVVLSGKDEFKIFQYYMYFSSDRAAVGL